jgi:outer membrane protein OmpA-like peptidoglycan-associated protein
MIVFYLFLLALPLAAQTAAQNPAEPAQAAESAQTPAETAGDVEQLAETPLFQADVVSRTVKAINYQYQQGATRIDFVGSPAMAGASGQAKVEGKRGYYEIEAEFRGIDPPVRFGSEYLTYVLWSISPEGRASNLGEVLIDDDGRAKLNVTSELQIFGLIVTAEPYFAVRQPSDVIVLENELREDTKGRVHFIESKTELLERGQYQPLANPLALRPDLESAPLEMYEARNAIAIAKSLQAEQYAGDTFTKATASLDMAEQTLQRLGARNRNNRREVARVARQTVQFAEDARELAVRRQAQERIETERRMAAEREAAAKAAFEEAARQRAEAEQRQKAEEEARQRAEKDKVEAERRSMEAEQKRLQAELAAAQAAAAKAEADAARAQALAEQQKATQAAQEAERLRWQAEQEKLALRRRLLEQFSLVLDARDTERGLVVNIGDVLFASGSATLRPEAREKLARFSGIVLAYPDLRLETEGHTDNVGSLEMNQKLSEERAEAVREYLISQGVPSDSISARGMNFSAPVADNDTAAGRGKNRRVEIIISGEIIGSEVSSAFGNQ